MNTPPSLSLPTPPPPHELKPRMSAFFQVTCVCRSSRTEWYRGWGHPSHSTSSSVARGTQWGTSKEMMFLLLPLAPKSLFSLAGQLPIARELSSSLLSSGSTLLALAKCHKILLARAGCPVASSQQGDSGNTAGNLWGLGEDAAGPPHRAGPPPP